MRQVTGHAVALSPDLIFPEAAIDAATTEHLAEAALRWLTYKSKDGILICYSEMPHD